MATKAKKLKLDAGPPAPQTAEECARAIAQYGAVMASRDRTVAEMNERIRSITETYQAGIETIDARMETLLRAIQTYCEAHRGEADASGVKHLSFTTGWAVWRKAPDAVVAPAKEEILSAAVFALKERGLTRFLRVRTEINKEAILCGRPESADLIAGIQGLYIRSGRESFSVQPIEVNP